MMDRIIIAFLAGSAAFGAVLLTELSDATDQPIGLPVAARMQSTAAPAAQRPRVEELVRAALAQPLFSPSRRPPDRATGDRTVAPELPNMRLTGIVIEPERHLAIFAVPGSKPLVRAVDRLGQWTGLFHRRGSSCCGRADEQLQLTGDHRR